MKKAQEIGQRIIALFLTSALGIVTGASVLGDIPIWKAAALAGFASIAAVVERLARASLDGKLTIAEIDMAFGGKPTDAPAKTATPVKKTSKRA